MENEKRTRKGMVRSPNYPAFPLGEAIERIQVVYQNERRASTTAEVIQKHLGYTPGTGPAIRTVSALRQYGLLDESSGQYRISDLGFTILHAPQGSEERNQALREAALAPSIFRELIQMYPDGLPSDVTLKSFLTLKRGFNPSTVDRFIATFRETIQLAKLSPGGYDGGEPEKPEEGPEMPADAVEQERGRVVSPDIRVLTWVLSMPRNVRAELRLFGRDLRREDMELLQKQLDLLKEAFGEPGQDGQSE